MRCYQHLDVEADAVCASCGRGICRQCQHPTIDQKMLCGMPQCTITAKQQSIVPFVIRQSCSNRAAECAMYAGLFRTISLLQLVPMGLIATVLFFSAITWLVNWFNSVWTIRNAPADLLYLVAVTGVLGLLAIFATGTWSMSQKYKKMQQTWEDLAAEFRGTETLDGDIKTADDDSPS
jgi:hypothetical protein